MPTQKYYQHFDNISRLALYKCMPKCKKCDGHFPSRVWIDGKRKNLQNRKYCFDCSPFGSHNTVALEKPKTLKQQKICESCHRVAQYGKRCYVCRQKDREIKVSDQVYSIVGDACWLCGYNRGRQMLDFHHMDPSAKKFSLHVRNICNLAWKRVSAEMKKCVLICCRCHREHHVGLILTEEIEVVYAIKWNEINKCDLPL